MSHDANPVKSLFLAALEHCRPGDWSAYLEAACAGDSQLRQRVELLLHAHLEQDSLLDAAPRESSPTSEAPGGEGPGMILGPYKLLEAIGEGSFGIVFMAEQTRPVRRKVALKVLKPGMDSKQVIARFEAERQALALMDHPHIARVLDAGQTDGGRPYFVMELVKGLPITDYCDQAQLGTRPRLELFVSVCQAVQHAHQKGIIHRDLKPANVLVTLHDGTPVVKVIDFGIAKALGQQLTDKTLFTQFAQLVGTPLYMSPEQAALSGLDVDTRSDIYALGVLLYELLTGTTPFDRERFKTVGYDELRRIIREEEPPRPSTRLSTLRRSATALAVPGSGDLKRLSQLLRGELDWIVMKCLEKDRNRRYESATALAAEVQRYLADEPVLACPPSAGYQLRKFARRHRVGLSFVTLVSLVLILAVVGLIASNARISRQERDKETALAEAQRSYEEAEGNLSLARQAVDEMYVQIASEVSAVPHLQRYQRQLLEHALRFYQKFAQRKSGDPVIRADMAHASVSLLEIQHTLGRRRDMERACRAAIAELEALSQALPSYTQVASDLGHAYGLLSTILSEAGRRQQAEKACRQAIAVYGHLVDEHLEGPEQILKLAAMVNMLGNLVDSPVEGEKCHWRAIHLCSKGVAGSQLEPAFQATLASSYLELGGLRQRLGQTRSAQEAFRQVIRLCDASPGARGQMWHDRTVLAQAQYALGGLLAASGRSEEAERAWRLAIELMETQVAAYPDPPAYRQTLAHYQVELATMLADQGRRNEAEACRRAVGPLIDQLLADLEKEMNDPERGPELPGFETRFLRDAGRLQDAEKVCRKMLERARKNAEERADDPAPRYRLAELQIHLGTVLERIPGRLRDAGDAFAEAVSIFDALSAAFPHEPNYQYAQVRARNSRGLVLRVLPGEADRAARGYRQALALCETLVAEHPEAVKYRHQLVRSHFGLGVALRIGGHWNDADRAYQDALAASRPLIDASGNGPGRFQYASIHNDLAWLRATRTDAPRQDPAVAVEPARKAVALSPNMGGFWNTLGVALYRAGQWKDAIGALERSRKLLGDNDLSFNAFFLAMAHWQLGHKDEARVLYKQAVTWMEKHQPRNEELRRFRAEAEQTWASRKGSPQR